MLLGGGGARYPFEGSGAFVGVMFLFSVSFAPDSSLFLFLGGGFGFSLISEGLSGSSSRNGFVLTGTEFEGLGELSRPSGLSGPNIYRKVT